MSHRTRAEVTSDHAGLVDAEQLIEGQIGWVVDGPELVARRAALTVRQGRTRHGAGADDRSGRDQRETSPAGNAPAAAGLLRTRARARVLVRMRGHGFS